MGTETVIPFDPPPPGNVGPADRANLILTQLAELEELRAAGMEMVRTLKHHAAQLPDDRKGELSGKHGVLDCMKEITRSILQIILLEQQTAGIRPMPEPRGGGGRNAPARNDNEPKHERDAAPVGPVKGVSPVTLADFPPNSVEALAYMREVDRRLTERISWVNEVLAKVDATTYKSPAERSAAFAVMLREDGRFEHEPPAREWTLEEERAIFGPYWVPPEHKHDPPEDE